MMETNMKKNHCDTATEAEMETFPPATPVPLKEHAAYSPGSVVSRTIFEVEEGTLTLFAFDKGQNLSEHTAPFNAFVQVLDGEAEIVIGGKPHRVKSGEMILMPADVPHAVNAVAKFKMLLTMIKSK
jgi:quercetin dioxygenase-like cupin family protein